jgi:hypothetical protein
MNHQTSGSNFSKVDIRRLKQFSLDLDVYLALKHLRFLSFSQDKKVLIDLKTLKPVEIKNESQCILKAYNNKHACVIVGSFTFIVKITEIKKKK